VYARRSTRKEGRLSIISRLYFSADEDYLSTAADELRPFFPSAHMEPLGPDIALFEDEGVSIAVLAETIRKEHLAFTRHLMRGVGEVAHEDARDLDELGEIALDLWDQMPFPDTVSLQVWQSGEADLPYRNDQLWRRLAAALNDIDVEVVRGGASHILSACQTGHGIIFGSNGAGNALSDWPGGRVKLAKPKGQVSRAEFKLEELFRTGAVDLPEGGKAMDLGAAPGGWSRILLERGFEVWAVDPAELDRRLHGRAGLHHIRTTAGPFLAETEETFDLVVNDMRMEPGLSASIMNSAARHLAPGGLGIMSVKLQPEHPLPTLDGAMRVLRKAWTPVFVRQLHHNRNEITVVVRRER
jgi:23S rRNA (cytidine2498-2'-O)-methyltransferase